MATRKTFKNGDIEHDCLDKVNTTYSNSTLETKSNSNAIFNKSTIENLQTTQCTATTIYVNSISLNDNDMPAPANVGQLSWNNTDRTIDVKLSSDVTMQIGQEILLRAVNKTGSDIANGKLVYISGASGNKPTITLADNTNYSNSEKLIGMTTEDIDKNENGFICTFGLVRGLNTTGLSEGTELYLDTNGDYTDVKPTPPIIAIRVGIVVVEHVEDGQICICIKEEKNNFGDVDSGDYSYFEEDGTYKAVGEATTWNDLPPNPIARSRQPAVNNPTLATLVGNIQQFTFAINDYVSDNLELLHEYKEESDMSFHIHWSNQGTESTTKSVIWSLEYAKANTYGAFTTATVTASADITVGTVDRQHFITAFPTVSGTGIGIGALFAYNIKRIASGNEPTQNPFGLQVSAHIEQDTLGSRQVFTK